MNTQIFCDMIRNRSEENRRALKSFSRIYDVLSPSLSILRQELDSMVRVIYLLLINNIIERRKLIDSVLKGDKLKVQTAKGKWRDVTDHEMVDLAQKLQGWTKSVYKFGCAFIHLSDFHNHHIDNPFEKLKESDKHDILSHMRYYHGGPCHDNPNMEEISLYIPQVFEKISSNLECYIKNLEKEATIDA
jgi:hypothetical protein